MKIYQAQLKRLIESVAEEILKGTLTQKRLTKIFNQLYKDMQKPTEQFLKRVYGMAYDEAYKAEHAMVNMLIAMNTEKAIKSLTNKEIRILSEHALTKNLIFTKWKNANRKTLVSDTYNLEQAINNLPTQISNDYRRRALAGMIAGDTPAQVASSMMDRNLSKKERRNIQTLYRTTAYKARSLANLQTMKENEAYFDYYYFDTMDDDRVETVCLALEEESSKQKWVTYDDVPVEAYTPVHFNCRCSIIPALKE